MDNLKQAILWISFTVLTPATTNAADPMEFIINAQGDKSVKFSSIPGEGAHSQTMAELLDGVLVSNVGCKDINASRWCLVRYRPTDSFGWLHAKFLDASPPYKIEDGSGEAMSADAMPTYCTKAAAETFNSWSEQISLLPPQSEYGGMTIDGTVEIRTSTVRLVLFKCLFDNRGRFVDVVSLISDGE